MDISANFLTSKKRVPNTVKTKQILFCSKMKLSIRNWVYFRKCIVSAGSKPGTL